VLENFLGTKERETEEHWISISDVMTGLMVMFLFIAISYMVNVRLKANKIIVYKTEVEKLLDAYANLHINLSEELRKEFEGNFRTAWHGHLDMETLSIRFKKPFPQGDAAVPNSFKNILRDFFPRYIAILTKPEYIDHIAEIRIEGHTSSEWINQVTGNEAYLKNMELSQNRARNVLDYVLRTTHSKVMLNRVWLKKNLTANGLASSQLILDLNAFNVRPANTYTAVAREADTSSSKIRQLHQRIRNLSHSKKSTRKAIIANLMLEFPEFEQRIAALERAVDLLLENREDSRRVEFRVITKSEKLIDEIEQLMKRFNELGIVD